MGRADDDEALRALLGQSGAAGCSIDQVRGDRTAAERLALAVLNAWLAELPVVGDAK